MTLDQFLEALKEIEDKPFIDKLDQVRFGTKDDPDMCVCPLMKVCEKLTGKFYTNADVSHAARALGLRMPDADFVVEIADYEEERESEIENHPELERFRKGFSEWLASSLA